MDQGRIRVRFFDPKQGPIELVQVASQFEYVEQLVFHILHEYNVGTVYRSLFGLKLMHRPIWFAPNQRLHDLLKLLHKHPVKNVVELRMRFRPSFLSELKFRDKNALDIIFAQLRYDFIHSRFNNEKRDLVLPNPAVLRLISTDLTRHAIEKNLSVDQLFQDVKPRDFIPHVAPKWQGAVLFWMRDTMNLKKSVEINLERCEAGDKLVQAKLNFIEIFLCEVCCDYGTETYRVTSVDDPEQHEELRVRICQNSDGVSCLIETRSLPVAKTKVQEKWDILCDIYSIGYATLRKQAVEINRDSGRPIRISFESILHAKSLLALIDGYYRLTRKWHFNFCRDVISPDLEFLRSIKCHGPIGSETSKLLLLGTKKPVAFLVRRCMEYSNRFMLEVLLSRAVRLEITLMWDSEESCFRIIGTKTTKGIKMKLKVDQDKFKSLKNLVDEIQICVERLEQTPILLRYWLAPSEFGDYPAVLLSISRGKLRDLIDKIENEHLQTTSELPKLIPHQILQLTNRPFVEAANYFEVTYAKLNDKREVIIKSFIRDPNRCMEMKQLFWEVATHSKFVLGHLMQPVQLRLADWIFVKGQAFAETIGLEFSTYSLIQEYFPLGTLDRFLRKETNMTETFRRLISCQVANAVLFLQEKRIVHGKIRCHNFFLKSIVPLDIRLSDPLGTMNLDEDQAFIPNEYRVNNGKLIVHDYDPAIDVWSLGTTLWQIYSDGQRPPTKKYADFLGQPAKCPDVIWSIIESCWVPDPARRASPQIILRDLNDAFVWEDDAHKYDYISRDYQNSPSLAESETSFSQPGSSGSTTPKVVYNSDNSSRTHDGSESDLLSQANGNHPNVRVRNQETDQKNPTYTNSNGTSLITARLRGRQLLDNIISLKKKFSTNDYQNSESDGSMFNMSSYTTGPESDSTKLTDLYDIESICSSADRCLWQLDTNRLKIGVEIGRGSSGVVLKGVLLQDNGDNQVVAVKCLKNTNRDTIGLTGDLKREFDILKSLNHQNIIKTLGFVDESFMMLIMEYMPLGSLQSRLKNSMSCHLSNFPLKKYALDIARGMEYLESMKIVHRDLALRNILVKSDNEVKICDFGLAQFTGSEDCYRSKTERALPLKWYAPETLRTWKFTHKSDVWSYGVVLWEIYSGGASPHYSGTYEDLLETLKHERLLRPKDCPQQMYSLMLACWAYEPEERYSFSRIVESVIHAINQISSPEEYDD